MTKRRTDGTSAFDTRTVGEDVSSFLIQQGKERLIEIQQHDGVVVEAAVISAGLRQVPTRGRGVTRGEGGARDLGAAPLPPPHYKQGAGGGAGP